MNTLDNLKKLQPTTPPSMGKNLAKTTDSISKLTSNMNEISSFLNESSTNSGDKPFNLKTFAREFTAKQSKSDTTETDKVTNSKPITRKVKQISAKTLKTVVQKVLTSDRLLKLLEKQTSKILSQAKVNYVKSEDGKLVAQPIQSEQVDKALANVQKITTAFVENVDKYLSRLYNTKPITSTKELQQNLSLNHIVDFIENVVAIYMLILKVKIKIRKAQDAAAAANALLTAPPQPLVAARFTQMALENTAAEQKQLDDLADTQGWISELKKKIDFYGGKYEKQKNILLSIQTSINAYTQATANKALQSTNNQISGSINNITGSLNKNLKS